MSSKRDDKNLMESLTDLVDSHLTEVKVRLVKCSNSTRLVFAQLSVATLALVGVGVVLRSIRFATKFTTNTKIPNSFIKRNISLRGEVKSVSTDGTLNVDHIPIVRMPWHWKPNQNNQLLSVSLAAIDTNISGVYWLKLNVENKRIWFKIIDRSPEQLSCIVWPQTKMPFRHDLSSELVSRGLAVVRPLDQRLAAVRPYRAAHKALTESQRKAQRNNYGVWYKPTKAELLRQRIQIAIESVKRLKNTF